MPNAGGGELSGGESAEVPDGGLRIFLNYRRDDTAGHAGRLYDSLGARFHPEHVFMDIDAIEPGTDFGEVIHQAMKACDVLLAVIGRQWLADPMGRRRLDDPDDFVRMELEGALERGVRIVPLLVQGAEMPSSTALPPSLIGFARRQALILRDESWGYDLGRLIALLEKFERELADQRRLVAEKGATEGQRAQRAVEARHRPEGVRSEHHGAKEITRPADTGAFSKLRWVAWGAVTLVAAYLAVGLLYGELIRDHGPVWLVPIVAVLAALTSWTALRTRSSWRAWRMKR